jgi:hypothetical protein
LTSLAPRISLWIEVLMNSIKSPMVTNALASLALISTACGNALESDSVAQTADRVATPAACRVGYSKVDWDGGGGFRADVTLSNVGGSNYDGWTLAWQYAGDQRVTTSWNGVATQADANLSITPGDWNRTLAPGDATTIVLLGTVTTASTLPTSFAVNGVACGDQSPSAPTPAAPASAPAPADPAPVSPASLPAAAAPAPAAPPPTSTPDAPSANGAWRPFSAASPWNTPIEANPKLDPDSAAFVSDFASSSPWPFFTINIQSYSVPVYYVDANTPTQTVRSTVVGGQGFDSGQAEVPIPAGATPADGTDQHLAIVNKQTSQEWGMWSTSNGPSGWTCAVCATANLADTGVRPPTQNPPWWMGHGARACGFPLTAGLITVDEMRSGSIEHALAIAYPHIRSRYYTSPASTAQTTTDLALPTRGVACGGRIQLDPSLDLDALGLSASGKIVARALQKYGAFVGDFSLAVSLYAESSPAAQAVWNTGLLSTYEIKDQVDLNRFRVLEVGDLFDNAN